MNVTRGQLRSYYKTPKWKERKASYFAKHEKKCHACGCRRGIDLHHVRYDRIGDEPDEDLRPLCRPCHDAAHQAVKDRVCTLEVAHEWALWSVTKDREKAREDLKKLASDKPKKKEKQLRLRTGGMARSVVYDWTELKLGDVVQFGRHVGRIEDLKPPIDVKVLGKWMRRSKIVYRLSSH